MGNPAGCSAKTALEGERPHWAREQPSRSRSTEHAVDGSKYFEDGIEFLSGSAAHAETKGARSLDIALMFTGLVAMIYTTIMAVFQWISD